MNAKTLIALTALTVAATGFAQEAPTVTLPTVSTANRAEVRAEAREAAPAIGEAAVTALPVVQPVVSRAAVKAQALQARRDGELSTGELMSFERHDLHPAPRATLLARR